MNGPLSVRSAPATVASDYMHFAKTRARARYNLATSGVADCDLADLGADLADLALHGENAYGHAPLVERIAGHVGVDPACVVTPGGGCSFANHLALAALIRAGDEVLVESPTYGLLLSTLGYLGADIRRFERAPGRDWTLDLEAVEAALTPRTRLVVLTNLHNPSGAATDVATMRALAGMAERVGARVMVDEVYLELMRDEAAPPHTAFDPDTGLIATSSLTKAYGLSGLRCGWILAPPDLAQRMRRLNDLFGVQPPHIAERLSLVAFDRLGALRARAHGMIAANRDAYVEILGDHPALEQAMCPQGTTMFPRLRRGDGESLLARLEARFETSVGPGHYFERSDRIRIGLAGDVEMTRAGLTRLAEALTET